MNRKNYLPIAIKLFIVLYVLAILFTIGTKSEKSLPTEEKTTPTIVKNEQTIIPENPPTTVIPQKNILPEIPNSKSMSFYDLEKEAKENLNITLTSSEEEAYIKIRERLLANDELMSLLKNPEIDLVFFKEKFYTVGNCIKINVNASDQKIIDYVKNAMQEVREYNKYDKEALKFKILLTQREFNEYKKIRERLLNNPELAAAFINAKEKIDYIHLSNKFQGDYISTVYIDVNASDKKIIAFLATI